jgi:hypothetical protein
VAWCVHQRTVLLARPWHGRRPLTLNVSLSVPKAPQPQRYWWLATRGRHPDWLDSRSRWSCCGTRCGTADSAYLGTDDQEVRHLPSSI